MFDTFALQQATLKKNPCKYVTDIDGKPWRMFFAH